MRRTLPAAVTAVLFGGMVALPGCSYSTESTLQTDPSFAKPTVPGPTSTTTPAVIPPVDALSVDSKVDIRGIGKVRVGMTVSEAEKAAGFSLKPPTAIADAGCYRVVPEGGPAGVTFVVADGTIATIEIEGAPITTRSGAGVGSTVEEIRALFPVRVSEEERGSGHGTLLVFEPSSADDAGYRVVFVIEDEQVIRYRAGRLPEVGQADPCA